MPNVTPEELLTHAAVYEEKIAYPYMFPGRTADLRRTADLLRAAANEICRLKEWLERDGCCATCGVDCMIGPCPGHACRIDVAAAIAAEREACAKVAEELAAALKAGRATAAAIISPAANLPFFKAGIEVADKIASAIRERGGETQP